MSNENFVIDLLERSTSPIEQTRNEAYSTIVRLESNPSFITLLIEIGASGNRDISKLSFICLKNIIGKLTKGNNARGISPSPESSSPREASREFSSSAMISNFTGIKKDVSTDNNNPACGQDGTSQSGASLLSLIKDRLLSVLGSVTNELCREYFILMRKLSRSEYPMNWMELHDLFQNVLEVLVKDMHKDSLNVLSLLHHVMKERITMRLLKDRTMTVKLIQHYYPFISKIWLCNWLYKWNGGNLSLEDLIKFHERDLKVSIYLDSLVLNFYSYGIGDIHSNSELLELLNQIILKLKLSFSLLKISKSRGITKMDDQKNKLLNLLVKSTKRLLISFSKLVENQPMSFVFVDQSLILDEVFEFLPSFSDEIIERACFTLLIAIFRSSELNNEKYSSIYFECFNAIPDVVSSISPVSFPRAKKLNNCDFKLYKTFEELKASCETSSPTAAKKAVSPKFKNLGHLHDHMQRQATFMFHETLNKHGGLLKFIEFLRVKYLILSDVIIIEWSEEPIPTEDPPIPISAVPELIDAININMSQIFNYIFNGIMNMEGNIPFYDSFLQLYTIAFNDVAKMHSYKHYIAILENFRERLESVPETYGKLLIYRTSRILDLWTKRPILDEHSKVEILKFLINCTCHHAEGCYSLNLKAQYLTPLYNLYDNTQDENIWNLLFKDVDVSYFVNSLLLIAKIDIPVIQYRCLELLCRICLEYEECGVGDNLLSVLSLYDNSNQQMMESIINTSLSFIDTLDWQRCFNDHLYLNPHFLNFISQIIVRTVVLKDEAIRSITKCKAMEDTVILLWLSLLRILPYKLDETEHAVLENIFLIFDPFIRHLLLNQELIQSNNALNILNEYLVIAIYINNNVRYELECNETNAILRVGDDLHYSCGFIKFSLTHLKELVLRSLEHSNNDQLVALSLLNNMMIGFDVVFTEYEIIVMKLIEVFCNELTKMDDVKGSGNKLMYLTDGNDVIAKENWVGNNAHYVNIELVEGILPIVIRFIDNEHVIRNYSNTLKAVTIPLINILNYKRHDIYLQFGVVICITKIAESVHKFTNEINLFLNTQNENRIFLPCYLLRIIDSILELCKGSKNFYKFARPTSTDDNTVPPSYRNKLLTYANITVKDRNKTTPNRIFNGLFPVRNEAKKLRVAVKEQNESLTSSGRLYNFNLLSPPYRFFTRFITSLTFIHPPHLPFLLQTRFVYVFPR